MLVVFLILVPAAYLATRDDSLVFLFKEKMPVFGKKGVAVVINGENKLVLKNRTEAENLLAWLKSVYPGEPGAVTGFKETVELADVTIREQEIIDLETAKKFIQSLVTVTATCEAVIDEEIPFPVEVRQDDKLLRGEQKVIQKGVTGKKIVTSLVTRENGLETGRVVLAEEVAREAVPQIVMKGTQVTLASRGNTTRLRRPVAGGVTSPYGRRDGKMHGGVDLAAGTGSPVTAAAGGKVISAGWEGSYGNMVEISHGGGLITRYAHLSSIKVGAGQVVSGGQLIGLAGATGNASGPHLHFEVIINGRQQDPAGYIS